MSHTENKEVTYLNGHRVKVDGEVYALVGVCRAEVREDAAGVYVVACSECGYAVGGKWADFKSAEKIALRKNGAGLHCPGCGRKLVKQ